MLGQTFPYLAVSGTAYEMGRQHGAQAGDLIRKYLQWIEFKARLSHEALCRNAMTLLPFIEALSPAYVEEVRGLADGARLRFEEAVLC